MEVTVRYFAAARAVAGRPEERFRVDEGTTLDGLLDRVKRALSADGRSREVIGRCSVLRNGETGPAGETSLADGDVLDLLPPFAGG